MKIKTIIYRIFAITLMAIVFVTGVHLITSTDNYRDQHREICSSKDMYLEDYGTNYIKCIGPDGQIKIIEAEDYNPFKRYK